VPSRPRQVHPATRRGARAASESADAVAIADRLHSAAIYLLRRLRTADAQAGLTGPQLSALSVIVFRGPIAVGALATAEQVRPPTVSRLVRELERRRLVERVAHDDARVQMVRATTLGARLLDEGRARRVEQLARDVAALSSRDRASLRRAAGLIAQLGRLM